MSVTVPDTSDTRTEVERSILSACLSPSVDVRRRAHNLVDRLRPEFRAPGHRVILAYIREHASDPPTYEGLLAELERHGPAPSDSTVAAFRLNTAQDFVDLESDVDYLVQADAERTDKDAIAVPRLADGMRESIARMRRRHERKEVPLPVPWPGLAAELGGGLWPGQFTVLVGNTGAGKSQLMMQAALAVARAENPTLYIALELDAYGMHARGLALALRDENPATAPKWSEFYLGEVSLDDLERAEDAAAKLDALPFHLEIGTPAGWDYTQLRPLAEWMRGRYPGRPLLLALDYVQLVDGDEKDDEVRLRMKRAAALGRGIAKDPAMNAAVVFLSSTARANYGALSGSDVGEKARKASQPPLGKGDPSRLVGAAKESGDIESTADNVLVLASEPWPDEIRPADGTHVWLAVAKGRVRSRNSRGGWVELRFDGSCFGEPPRSTTSGQLEA